MGQATLDRFHMAPIAQLGERCTGNAEVVVGLNPVQSLNVYSGLFSSGVIAAFASIIMSTLNCYCWASVTMERAFSFDGCLL